MNSTKLYEQVKFLFNSIFISQRNIPPSSDNKTLINNLLQTLNTPTEDSKTDFFNNKEEYYVPEISTFFGLSKEDIKDAINEYERKNLKRK